MTRVIAGRAGGQRLVAPTGDITRPTTDRVREAVFSAIVSWAGGAERSAESGLSGLSFLDLYAGSAGIALEAASRGAAPVLAIESARAAAQVARRNIRDTRLEVQLRSSTVETFLAGPPEQSFDVIWADPPYAVPGDRVDRLLAGAVSDGWLAEDGLLVLERSSRSAGPDWPPGFAGWLRRYGETTVHFAQYQPPEDL